jgi:hypothetical protein
MTSVVLGRPEITVFREGVGSRFLITAPVLLGWAFTIEPERGLQEGMWRSWYGLYFLGCMLHLICGATKSENGRKPVANRGGL